MEVSKLFASVGFRVDTKNLDHFEARLSGAQTKFVSFAGAVDNLGKKADQAIVPVNRLLKSLDFKGTSTGITPLANALEKLDSVIKKMDMGKFHSNIQKLTYALDEARPSIHKSANAWDKYAQAVARARSAVTGTWSGVGRPPNPPTGAGAIGGAGAGGGHTIVPLMGGRTSTSSPHYTPQSRLLTPMVGSHMAYLASGGVMAGVGAIYATKEILNTAQENLTAENFVRMSSKDESEFKKNQKFVWDNSQKFGVDYNTALEGFGKIYMNTNDSLGREGSLKIITDLMKYNTAMHTSKDSQKMIVKALSQMASTGRVNAADYNQWEEHVAGGSKVAGMALDKLAKEGKIDKDWRKKYNTARAYITDKDNTVQGKYMTPALTSAMADFTQKGLETGMDSYQSAGARFGNKVTMLARDISEGGLFDVAKNFFDMLSSIMDIIRDLMPVIGALTATLAFLFRSFADGIKAVKEFASELLTFTSITDSLQRGVLLTQMSLWAFVALMLPKILARIKIFFNAVRVIMASNPILLALMAIITVAGFLYGQWELQKKGITNWMNVAYEAFLLVGQYFKMAWLYIQLTFWNVWNGIVGAITGFPKMIANVFSFLRSEFKWLDQLMTWFEKFKTVRDETKKDIDDVNQAQANANKNNPYAFQQSLGYNQRGGIAGNGLAKVYGLPPVEVKVPQNASVVKPIGSSPLMKQNLELGGTVKIDTGNKVYKIPASLMQGGN